jgi:predicted acylesterase/phospholipase RssA
MHDIFLREAGHLEGFSIGEFDDRFRAICQSHIEEGRALAFAFIFFEYDHPEVREVLCNQKYWDALDQLSGRYLTVFSINLKQEEATRSRSRDWGRNPENEPVLHSVNDILQELFQTNLPPGRPRILFFQVHDGQVLTPYVYDLRADSAESAFHELRDALSNAVESVAKVKSEFRKDSREVFELIKQSLSKRKLIRKYRGAAGLEPLPDDVLFLSLSGGGLRATIFHLGVFLFLSEARRLEKVRGIVSVSGGSIVAGHLVNRWQEAIKSHDDFDRVAADLIAFTRTDLRHSVFIPWLWSRLVPINWWRQSQSRTSRLKTTYDKHFQGQTLGGLDDLTRPFLAMVATDAIKQERIAFTAKNIFRFPIVAGARNGAAIKSAATVTIASGVPLALAVAASSCFPPVFPRMRLTNHDLGLNYEDFKDTFYLNDGGVTDNLGLEVLLELKSAGHDLGDRILVCNVERPLRDKPGNSPLADQAAQSAALSKAAEVRIEKESGHNCSFVRISDRPQPPLALVFLVQTKLAVFRTDLDAPKWGEIQALLLHGYSCAARTLDEHNYASLSPAISRSRVSSILKLAGCQETLSEPVVDDFKHSHARPKRRIALHLALVILTVIALASGGYFALMQFTGKKPSSFGKLNVLPAPKLTPPSPAESMREVSILPDLDYRPFELKTYDMFVDMRLWKRHNPSELVQKISPVIFSRKIIGIKREPVDHIRIYGATEGTGIDAACVSGQPYWIEHAQGTGNPRTVMMHKYHVVIDISSVSVGSRFEVEVQMTMWNGLKEEDPWLAFVAFTEIPEFRIQIVFPVNRPYKTRKFVKYPNQQDQEVSAESEFKQLERPQHSQIYWEVKPAVKNTTYELQWTW